MSKKTAISALTLLALTVSCSSLTRSDDEGTIRLSGNIEMTEVKVSFKISGKLIERTVDEGEVVEKDMVIARLDSEQLLRQRDQAAAARKAADSQLTQLRTAIEFQRETVEGQIDSRQAELK
ncbi:MAG: biotin/lipoyl-binding protein, partial [bacterium]|nr:biotin/lipoyl-binding protein [bacterium]